MAELIPTTNRYASGLKPPSALLRALKNPVYDTERFANADTAVTFFQRPLGQDIAAGIPKTLIHTNMTIGGQLGTPLVFDLYGFRFKVPRDTLQPDYQSIYNNGVFEFILNQNRPWLQVPLSEIPAGVDAEGFAATGVAATTVIQIHNGTGHVSNFYNFLVGDKVVRIFSTESFQVRVTFPTTAVVLAANRDCTVFLVGILWSGL